MMAPCWARRGESRMPDGVAELVFTWRLVCWADSLHGNEKLSSLYGAPEESVRRGTDKPLRRSEGNGLSSVEERS